MQQDGGGTRAEVSDDEAVKHHVAQVEPDWVPECRAQERGPGFVQPVLLVQHGQKLPEPGVLARLVLALQPVHAPIARQDQAPGRSTRS